MNKLISLAALCAGVCSAQIIQVQKSVDIEPSPSIAQWFFKIAPPKPGDLMLVAGSVNAGTILSAPNGWSLMTCDQIGSNANSNPVTASNEQVQVWYHVATSGDTSNTAYAFLMSTPQAYVGAVFYEFAGIDTNIPIDYCYLTGNTNSSTSFTTAPSPAPNIGDVAIAIEGAYQDNSAKPVSVSGYTFSLSADAQAPEWSTHTAVSSPSTDTTTAASATFTYPATVSGSVATGIVWLKAAGTGGLGEQPGIAWATSSNTHAVAEGQSITLTFNRTVNLTTTGVGTWSCTTNCTSSVYTAPAQVSGGILRKGVMITPPDSVYAQDISNFPVNQYSSRWVSDMHSLEPTVSSGFFPDGSGGSWGEQLIDNTTPMTTHTWLYGCTNCSSVTPFPNPPLVTREHENGAFQHNDGNGSYDTHETFLNRQTGQVWSLYGVSPYNTNSNLEEGATFDVNSLSPWTLPGSGSAGGMAYEVSMLTPDDVRYGLHHPLDIAFPEITMGSCGYGASQWAVFGYEWPASYTNVTCTVYQNGTYTHIADAYGATDQTEPPAAGLPGLGTWYRLSNSWCTANLSKYSGMEYNLLAGACQYGWILTDWSNGGQFEGHADSDIHQDPAVMKAIAAANSVVNALWNNATSQASAFEFVDVSTLSPCSNWWNCGDSVLVNPSASYLKSTPGYVQFTASDSGTDTPITGNLALLRTGVGTLHPYITAVAGSTGLQLTAYVNNSTNQTVTWTKDTAPSTGAATVSPSGAVTLTPSVSTVTFDYFTGTAAADSNAQVHVLVKTIPSNSDGSIRIDSGSSTCVYTDSNGINWIGDLCLGNKGQAVKSYTTGNWPAGVADQHIWATNGEAYDASGDIDYGDFYVPNQNNWKVTAMMNPDRTTGNGKPGTSLNFAKESSTFNGCCTFAGPTPVSANGSFGGFVNFGLLGDSNHVNTAATDYRYSFPANATPDHFIDLRFFSSHGPSVGHEVSIAGVYMIPDTTTTPHWAIDTQETTQVPAGTSLALYMIDWYTGAGGFVDLGQETSISHAPCCYSTPNAYRYVGDNAKDATWSFAVQGCTGSSIGAQSGIYTAPASTPAQTCSDVVMISNGTYSATATLTVPGSSNAAALGH